MIKYVNRGSFICDRCRNICKGECHELLTAILNGDNSQFEKGKDLIGRKQIIHCLGPYCDNPCQLQRKEYTPFNEEDGLKPLFNLIDWMGNKIHNLLENKND